MRRHEPPRFPDEGGKVRNRRILVVASPSGEGPFTIRFADLGHRAWRPGSLAFTTAALTSPLRSKLDKGKGNEGDQGSRLGFRVLGPGAGLVRTRKSAIDPPSSTFATATSLSSPGRCSSMNPIYPFTCSVGHYQVGGRLWRCE